MHELALFAGAGGGILGGRLLGWRTVCAVECDPYAASVLVSRQNDGTLDAFPIWDDVRTFDGRPWRGIVDVISGGFPCQDISVAGRREGIDGEKSGLWSEMARIISEVRPRFVFVENSPAIIRRGLARVLGDLAVLGYDARWRRLSALELGAPHRRDRFWLVATDANRDAIRHDEQRHEIRRHNVCHCGNAESPDDGRAESMANADGRRQSESQRIERKIRRRPGDGSETIGRPEWWTVEPNVGRVAHGVANRVDKLRCLGNGQVPSVAAKAWELLTR